MPHQRSTSVDIKAPPSARLRRRGPRLLWAAAGIIALAFLPALLFGVAAVLHDPLHAPKGLEDTTVQKIYAARHAIADHYAEHGRLPNDLRATLRAQPHQGDLDSWRRPFQLRVREDGVTVEISALGDDGKPGGSGRNRDITGVFRADIPAGKQLDHVGAWLKDPLDDVKPWTW